MKSIEVTFKPAEDLYKITTDARDIQDKECYKKTKQWLMEKLEQFASEGFFQFDWPVAAPEPMSQAVREQICTDLTNAGYIVTFHADVPKHCRPRAGVLISWHIIKGEKE